MMIKERQKRIWAEINYDNLLVNYSMLPKNVCCVVKANAYGLGDIQLSKKFMQYGAKYLAVSNIEEALKLRKAGISGDILVLGYTSPACVEELATFNICQAIYNLDYAKEFNKQCLAKNVFVSMHLKIDTGMGRLGFQYHDGHDELSQALAACRLSNLKTVGIFTHFACSDEGVNDYTIKQFSYFEKAISFLERHKVEFQVKHCSNSAAIIDYPNYHLDMVRAGLLLYGINPTQTAVPLKPVLSLWSVVSNVKTVKKGDAISYGRSFVAQEDMTIATIPVGYADGFWRSNQGHHVYLNGTFCEIVGRVCMDQVLVKCESAKIGDLVEIYGEHVTVEEVAKYNHTIPYEILCAIGERVPRVYLEHGKIVEVVDKLV